MSQKYQKDPRENQWNFITSVECKVKHSQRSGMSQSFFLGTRLGMQSLQVFGFIRLFDKVSAELV